MENYMYRKLSFNYPELPSSFSHITAQWMFSAFQDQFETHVSPFVHLSIYLYYGANREKNANIIAQQDVVLTTYSTISSDAKVRYEMFVPWKLRPKKICVFQVSKDYVWLVSIIILFS